uniref:Aminoglycoside 3''-phosphotransferase n=1 Tax=Escherichia coli TaxID=562 RepID=A0A890DGX4_ECOLX|nr:Aminoglycoside 3''-phosphotransferase [Escherichia coli]
MNRTNIFFGESHSDWLPVRGGESGDFVFRRGDGHAFAKIAPASRRGELAGERDRLIWLKGRGVACPEVINWQEEQEGACLVITAIPGVPAADLSGADLLKAWPSMGQQLGAVHSLSVDQCPFERRLSRMFGRAVDVVSPAMPSIPTSYRTRTRVRRSSIFWLVSNESYRCGSTKSAPIWLFAMVIPACRTSWWTLKLFNARV